MAATFLFKMVGHVVARHIERGSTKGAFVGTGVGLVAALSLTYWLYTRGSIESPVAPGIAFSLGFMLAGAIVGSMLGPRGATVASGTVTLTNFNRGLVPLFVVAVGIGVLVLGLKIEPKQEEDRLAALGFKIGGPAVAAIALLVQVRTVLWLRIGPDVFLGRILGGRSYRPDEVASIQWSPPSAGHDPPFDSEDGELAVRFTDGREVAMAVPARKVEALLSALAAVGVRTPATAPAH